VAVPVGARETCDYLGRIADAVVCVAMPEPLQAVALTTLPGVEAHPSFSPDGNHVVFSWTDPQGNQDLYVQMIGSGSPLRRTTDARHDYNPVWSPDGRWIAFFRSQPPAPTGLRSRELLLIPPLGGSERKVADVRSHDFFRADMYLAWADSKSLVVTDIPTDGQLGALFLVSIETGEKRKLTNPQPPVLADTSPAVSSDGRQLVFLRRTSWGAGELHLQPLAPGSESRRLTRADLSADFPAWTPDDQEIVFSAKEGLWRMRVAGENEPVRLPYIGEGGVMPAISRAQPGKPARLVYVHSFTDINFWRIETPGLGAPSSSPPAPTAISSTKLEYHIQLSPDGRRAAFTSLRSGDPELWVSDADGSNAVALTSMHARDTNCAFWSPDGRTIAFSSTGDREFDLYVVPATGGAARQLTSHPAIDVGPTFSPDGRWIYFASMRTGDYRIWKMPAGGGDAVQVTPTQAARALEASDGSLYYVEFSVVSPLWRLRPGGAPEKVLDDILWFNFTIVKNGIYYITPAAGETQLRYLDLATGRSTMIARNLGDVAAGITASPDGKTILYTRIDASVDDLMLVENFR